MTDSILAHAGGVDEMAILLFPLFVGAGVWIFTRQGNPPPRKPRRGPTDPGSKPLKWN
jgi:hypothetical protein